jgi:hypothetical protein
LGILPFGNRFAEGCTFARRKQQCEPMNAQQRRWRVHRGASWLEHTGNERLAKLRINLLGMLAERPRASLTSKGGRRRSKVKLTSASGSS